MTFFSNMTKANFHKFGTIWRNLQPKSSNFFISNCRMHKFEHFFSTQNWSTLLTISFFCQIDVEISKATLKSSTKQCGFCSKNPEKFLLEFLENFDQRNQMTSNSTTVLLLWKNSSRSWRILFLVGIYLICGVDGSETLQYFNWIGISAQKRIRLFLICM